VPANTVLVTGENPSLASALADLFRADSIPVSTVRDLAELNGGPDGSRSMAGSVVVLASGGYESPTTRKWATDKWSDTDLVVVGTRDPGLRSRGRFHVVRLPLVPTELLQMVHRLIDRRTPAPEPRAFSV